MRPARNHGFTLIELLIVVAIVAIIASIAAVNVVRSRAAANEASAIASMRVTSSSQKAYAIACGRGAYAPSYVVLGTPPIPGDSGFISRDLGTVLNPVKSGFQFSMAPGAGSTAGPTDCNGGPTVTAFYATGVPISTMNGARSFAVNGNGAVWQLRGSAAPTEPFGPPASIIQ